MKTFTSTILLALVTSLAQATPMNTTNPFPDGVSVSFQGDSASYLMAVPIDKKTFPIGNPLSVSHITMEGGAATWGCLFHGIDGKNTVVVPGQGTDVGPPQSQTWGICGDFS